MENYENYYEKKPASTKTLLIRGLRLRCPNCGKGKLFRKGFTMYKQCPICGWIFEREEGYWTGAIALNLVLTELLVVVLVVPLSIALAASNQSIILFLILFLPVPILLPFLFFRHAKSLWMSIDFILHPVDEEGRI